MKKAGKKEVRYSKLQFLTGLILFFTLYSLLFTLPVRAQEVIPLIVAPAKQELSLSPGSSTAVNIRFYNQADVPISGFVRAVDFIVEDNKGTPKLIEDLSQTSPRFSAAQWFSLPFDKATIAAKDKVEIQAKITVPQNARPGGKYVAIFFQPASQVAPGSSVNKEAGSSVTSRIAGLVYIRVPGPITENALITSFFSKSFWEFGPINIRTEILNRSDYHIRPRGTITIKNMFGGSLERVRLEEANIFPDASRTFDNKIGPKWMMGRYQLDLSASYGDKGRSLTSTAYVWVFPWRTAVVVTLGLIIIYLLIRVIALKAKNRSDILETELKHEQQEIENLKRELSKRNE